MEKWEKNANRFLWTQRLKELQRVTARFPNSLEQPRRQKEINQLVQKLEELEKE